MLVKVRTGRPAISLEGCPDELIAWLVESGLDVNDQITHAMQKQVTRLGKQFERKRGLYLPEYLDETVEALGHLYAVFAVDPVPPHVMHDGVSPIVMPRGTREEQFDALWDVLVPMEGVAATAQGEVLRIAAEIDCVLLGDDDEDNEWGRDHKKMLAALPQHFESGVALSRVELAELKPLTKQLRPGRATQDDIDRLYELAVTWVGQNVTPLPPGKVRYRV